jgi:hypothetical protein
MMHAETENEQQRLSLLTLLLHASKSDFGPTGTDLRSFIESMQWLHALPSLPAFCVPLIHPESRIVLDEQSLLELACTFLRSKRDQLRETCCEFGLFRDDFPPSHFEIFLGEFRIRWYLIVNQLLELFFSDF